MKDSPEHWKRNVRLEGIRDARSSSKHHQFFDHSSLYLDNLNRCALQIRLDYFDKTVWSL
jgi:hypothetical protein